MLYLSGTSTYENYINLNGAQIVTKPYRVGKYVGSSYAILSVVSDEDGDIADRTKSKGLGDTSQG